MVSLTFIPFKFYWVVNMEACFLLSLYICYIKHASKSSIKGGIKAVF